MLRPHHRSDPGERPRAQTQGAPDGATRLTSSRHVGSRLTTVNHQTRLCRTNRFSLILSTLSALLCLNATGCLRTMVAIDPRTLPISTALGQQLQGHVSFLASPALMGRQPGSVGNRQAAQYIADQFRAIGLQPLPSLGGYRQVISPQIGDNLLGIIPPAAGAGAPRWVMI